VSGDTTATSATTTSTTSTSPPIVAGGSSSSSSSSNSISASDSLITSQGTSSLEDHLRKEMIKVQILQRLGLTEKPVVDQAHKISRDLVLETLRRTETLDEVYGYDAGGGGGGIGGPLLTTGRFQRRNNSSASSTAASEDL